MVHYPTRIRLKCVDIAVPDRVYRVFAFNRRCSFRSGGRLREAFGRDITRLSERQRWKASEWDLYSKIKPKAHRKPNPLSIFNVGTENFGANTVTVELGKPIFELSGPIWSAPTQKRGSDNPFLAMFLTIDVVFIFKIVLSALAILFAYNTISGEREDGTLKLVLSNSIPRDTIVFGKYLGGMLSLFPIVLMSLIVALIIALSSRVTAFEGNDIAHIVLIFGCFAVVRVNVVSFRVTAVGLDEDGCDDVDPFDVYLG